MSDAHDRLAGLDPDRLQMLAVLGLATQAHSEQTRPLVDGTTEPYVAHPVRVMESLASQGHTLDVQLAALLHDAIEDTYLTADILTKVGVPYEAICLVLALTRRENETYAEFIDRIIEHGEPAISMKIADIEDNLAGMHPAFERLRPRYEQSLVKLHAAQTNE